MPYITVEGPDLEIEKKRDLVRGLTEAASEVFGMEPEKIMVTIRNPGPENFSIGGELLIDKMKKGYEV
ncbi:MAG: 4-oxalocrotonate tautomerase DmpI [Actinomycetota bacterium]|nr:4-oxalocrotonate tautomerase DmpI [Actinomycetota bacterium]